MVLSRPHRIGLPSQPVRPRFRRLFVKQLEGFEGEVLKERDGAGLVVRERTLEGAARSQSGVTKE